MIIPMDAPLIIRRNDNPFRVQFVFENPDGSVIDMTGVTAKWQARAYPGAPGAPLLEATTGEPPAPRVIASGLGLELILSNAAIEALPPGEPGLPVTIHHDLLVTMEGDENAWAAGAVTVEWGVTND